MTGTSEAFRTKAGHLLGHLAPAVVTAVLWFFLDQWTKAWAVNTLKGTPGMTIIPSFFHLTYGENTGAAFGILRGNPTLLAVVSLAVLALMIWFATKIDWRPWSHRIAAGLIAGGAAGNLLDRFTLGYVVDFLDFQFGNWHYPTFNFADTGICVGVGMFLVRELFFSQQVPLSSKESS